jgi:hypothetical protein
MDTRALLLARESKLLRRLSDLDTALDTADAHSLDLDARRLAAETSLKSVLRQLDGGCKLKDRELRDARDSMRA